MKSLLATLFITATTLAFAGDHVGNGGGLAEKNILLGYERLDQFISLCLNSQICKVSDSQKTLLIKIKEALSQERAVKDQIQFVSEKAYPGTFIINGEMKVAKTGDTIGSKILFNTDLLYTRGGNGFMEAMSLAESVVHLIHEMGHHHGNYEHTELDNLGIKVSMLLQQHLQTTPFLPLTNQISAIIINERGATSLPQVILYVFGDMIDVSTAFANSLECSRMWVENRAKPGEMPKNLRVAYGNGKADETMGVEFAKPLSAIFHNVYWSDYKLKKNSGHFELKGNLTNLCKWDEKVDFNDNNYKASVRFNVELKKEKDGTEHWQLKNNSVSVKQHYEPWWKIIKLPSIFKGP